MHLDGPPGLTLEQDLDSAHHKDWDPHARPRATRRCPRRSDLRVSGWRFSSKDFELNPDDQGRATVQASGGSIPMFILGLTGLVGGGGTSFVGTVFFLWGAGAVPGADGGPGTPDPRLETQDLILLAIGVPVAVMGAILMGTNLKTAVLGDVLPPIFSARTGQKADDGARGSGSYPRSAESRRPRRARRPGQATVRTHDCCRPS